MQLIRDVVLAVRRTGNTMLAYHAAEKIKQTIRVQSALEPMDFLRVLINDYYHIHPPCKPIPRLPGFQPSFVHLSPVISQQTIQQIISHIDIVEIVGGFVKLKKRGTNYLGLCPFHNEKTPSFTVSPTKEIYKCFGCGRSGNSISFLMEHEKFSYVEALRWLAAKYNIAVEETELSLKQSNKTRQPKAC